MQEKQIPKQTTTERLLSVLNEEELIRVAYRLTKKHDQELLRLLDAELGYRKTFEEKIA